MCPTAAQLRRTDFDEFISAKSILMERGPHKA